MPGLSAEKGRSSFRNLIDTDGMPGIAFLAALSEHDRQNVFNKRVFC